MWAGQCCTEHHTLSVHFNRYLQISLWESSFLYSFFLLSWALLPKYPHMFEKRGNRNSNSEFHTYQNLRQINHCWHFKISFPDTFSSGKETRKEMTQLLFGLPNLATWFESSVWLTAENKNTGIKKNCYYLYSKISPELTWYYLPNMTDQVF